MGDITKKWTGRRQDWSVIHAQMAVYFEGRICACITLKKYMLELILRYKKQAHYAANAPLHQSRTEKCILEQKSSPKPKASY